MPSAHFLLCSLWSGSLSKTSRGTMHWRYVIVLISDMLRHKEINESPSESSSTAELCLCSHQTLLTKEFFLLWPKMQFCWPVNTCQQFRELNGLMRSTVPIHSSWQLLQKGVGFPSLLALMKFWPQLMSNSVSGALRFIPGTQIYHFIVITLLHGSISTSWVLAKQLIPPTWLLNCHPCYHWRLSIECGALRDGR